MTHNPLPPLLYGGTGSELLRSYQAKRPSALEALKDLLTSQTAAIGGANLLMLGGWDLPHGRTHPESERDDTDSAALLPKEAPARLALEDIIQRIALSIERVAQLMAVTRQSVHLWRQGGAISQHNLERLLALQDVLDRAGRFHPTPQALQGWLQTPRGAEGHTPWQLLVQGEFDRARLLAMTKPSPGLLQPPAWLSKPSPPAMQTGRESRIEAYPPADREPLVDDDDAPADEGWVE